MPDKRDLNFEYDERTNVPTYEEVRSVFSKNPKQNNESQPKNKKQKIFSKPSKNPNNQSPNNSKGPNNKNISKKVFVISFLALILIAFIGGGGFLTYKYKDNLGEMNSIVGGKVTGFFAVTNEEELKTVVTAFTVKPIKIDLKAEDEATRLEMLATCEKEKGSVASDIRKQKETECSKEKTPLIEEIENLENEYDDLSTKYKSCKTDLSDCEDSSSV